MRDRATRLVPLLTGLVVAVVVLGPVLTPARLLDGYVLRYDMVFVPRQSLFGDGLGLGTALPRAAPVDFVVAVATTVVSGAILQKLVLLATVVTAVAGAARLVPAQRVVTRVAAGVFYGWNAYVDERLLQGHWALLVGYAALPWVASAAIAVRTDAALRRYAALTVGLAVAALTPTGGVLAALVALCVVGWPPTRARAILVTAALAVAVNAPWWVPGALHPGGARSDPAGVAIFAAHADTPLGVLGSVLSLGGIWNAQAVPMSRAMAVLAPVLVVVLLVVAAGVVPLVRRLGPAGCGLLLAAGLGLLAALVAAVPGGEAALRAAVAHVPGAGLLRDAQKYVAPLALAEAVAFGLGVEQLGLRLRDAVVRRAVLTVAVVLPIVSLPALAWGALGALEPVRYPHEWDDVRRVLAADPRAGDAVVLPWQAFRRYGWNDDRTLLDPATRYFSRTVVAADDLPVDDRVVHGEDPRSAAVGALLDSGGPLSPGLAAAGIRYVLVERDAHAVAPVPRGALAGLVPVHTGSRFEVYEVPGPVSAAPGGAPFVPVVVADVAAGALLVAAVVVVIAGNRPPAKGSRYAARHD